MEHDEKLEQAIYKAIRRAYGDSDEADKLMDYLDQRLDEADCYDSMLEQVRK